MISIGLIPSSTGVAGGMMTGDSMNHYIDEKGPLNKVFDELVIQGFALQWIEPSYDIDHRSSIDIPGEDNDGFIGIDSFSGPDDRDTVSNVVVSKEKIDTGLRYFPPEKPSFFEVGFNVGKTLRSYSDGSASGTHNGPRPHIRRSHWHTFLSGKRDSDRIRSLKWLPPIPVNFDGSEVTPTIHHV
jgi:hypothetical protein